MLFPKEVNKAETFDYMYQQNVQGAQYKWHIGIKNSRNEVKDLSMVPNFCLGVGNIK